MDADTPPVPSLTCHIFYLLRITVPLTVLLPLTCCLYAPRSFTRWFGSRAVFLFRLRVYTPRSLPPRTLPLPDSLVLPAYRVYVSPACYLLPWFHARTFYSYVYFARAARNGSFTATVPYYHAIYLPFCTLRSLLLLLPTFAFLPCCGLRYSPDFTCSCPTHMLDYDDYVHTHCRTRLHTIFLLHCLHTHAFTFCLPPAFTFARLPDFTPPAALRLNTCRSLHYLHLIALPLTTTYHTTVPFCHRCTFTFTL